MHKAPFYIVQEFVSPLYCEEIVDDLASLFTVPDTRGKTEEERLPLKMSRHHERHEGVLFDRLQQIVPQVEKYYNIEYKATETMQFEWFPTTSKGTFECGNSKYLRQKWLRVHDRDLTGILFLVDYQEKVPFETDYEVYGGKLEFVQHYFGFNPQRGTLILFPSDPHFINITSEILVGDLYQVRFHIAAKRPYLYNPQQFPGNYTTWFKPLLEPNKK